jgi:hypothetical protein
MTLYGKCYNQKLEAFVVGFTIGSTGKVPGKTCEKRRINNNNNNNSEEHTKPINTLCGQTTELMNVKIAGTF